MGEAWHSLLAGRHTGANQRAGGTGRSNPGSEQVSIKTLINKILQQEVPNSASCCIFVEESLDEEVSADEEGAE